MTIQDEPNTSQEPDPGASSPPVTRHRKTWWDRIRRKRSRSRVLLILIGGIFQQASPTALIVGGAILALARLLQTWSYGHLHKASRTNPNRPDEVTRSGPYAHVRNPILLGSTGSDIGFLIMAGNPYIFAAYAVAILPIHFIRIIILEEPHLKREYGEAYER